MSQSEQVDSYSEAETEARREAALKRMLATPHKPHKASRGNAQHKPVLEKPE